jgi:YggT family protein
MDLLGLLNTFVNVYIYLIIARVLLSWLPAPRGDVARSIYKMIYDVTEPYLAIFRRIIPSLGGRGMGIDISPMIAIMALVLLRNFLFSVL